MSLAHLDVGLSVFIPESKVNSSVVIEIASIYSEVGANGLLQEVLLVLTKALKHFLNY